MLTMLKLTPTEARLCEVLSDGLSHRVEELEECCGDSDALPTHLSNLRRKLEPAGRTVWRINEQGVVFYRMMRLTSI